MHGKYAILLYVAPRLRKRSEATIHDNYRTLTQHVRLASADDCRPLPEATPPGERPPETLPEILLPPAMLRAGAPQGNPLASLSGEATSLPLAPDRAPELPAPAQPTTLTRPRIDAPRYRGPSRYLKYVFVAALFAAAIWLVLRQDTPMATLGCLPNCAALDLSRINLAGVAVRGASFENANLQSARMAGASLFLNNLTNVNLRNADLRNADLAENIFNGADLRGANLAGASLRRSDLRNADLRGAILAGADLRGADLTAATLLRADLSGAILTETDFSNAILRRVNLSNADLRRADLTNADLRRATLTGATFAGADLNGVILDDNQVITSIGEMLK